ncbi:MAG: hypothetical protein H0X37_21310 [Herpetosiphonaceae bacterium]|nr:hypothetical protein [Herpetosiphonaceae bacterium]
MSTSLYREALTLHTRLAIRADDAARRLRQFGRVEDVDQYCRLSQAARHAQRRMIRRFLATTRRPTTDNSPTSR